MGPNALGVLLLSLLLYQSGVGVDGGADGAYNRKPDTPPLFGFLLDIRAKLIGFSSCCMLRYMIPICWVGDINE